MITSDKASYDKLGGFRIYAVAFVVAWTMFISAAWAVAVPGAVHDVKIHAEPISGVHHAGEFSRSVGRLASFTDSSHMFLINSVPPDNKRYLVQSSALLYLAIWLAGFGSAGLGFWLTRRMTRGADKALLESEKRFRDIASNSGEWIWEGTPDGKFSYASPAVEKVIGYKPEEVVGKNMLEFVHPDDRDRIKEAMKKIVGRKAAFTDMPSRKVHKDGHTIIAETSGAPILDSAGELVGYRGAMRDVTARKEAEENLGKLNRRFRMLSRCNQILARARDEAELLQSECRLIVEEGGYRMMWIGFAENDSAKTVRPVAQAGFEEGYLERLDITWSDNQRGRGPTGTAIRTAVPVVARDILQDPAFEPWRRDAVKRGYASSVAIPVIFNGKVIGALNLYSSEADAFDDDEISFLEELAEDLAYGITTIEEREKRLRHEKELADKARHAEFVASVGDTLTKCGTIDEILNQCAQAMVDKMEAELARIWIFDERKETLELLADAGAKTPNLDDSWSDIPMRSVPVVDSVITDNKPYFTNDAVNDPQVADSRWVDEHGMSAYAAIPLVVGERLVGITAMYFKNRLDTEDIKTLESAASAIALGIDRAGSEKTLRESRTMLQMVIDNIPHYIFWKDTDFVYGGCNSCFAEANGLERPEDIVGKTDADLAWLNERASYQRERERMVIRSGKPEYDMIETRLRDGVEVWLTVNRVPLHDSTGAVAGILCTYEDITEKIESVEERARLATAIEHASEAVVITDINGTIQYVNPAFEKITGYSRGEAVGQNPRILKSGEHDDEFYKEMWDTITSGEVWRGLVVNKKKDDSMYKARVSISPVTGSSGEVVNFIAVQNDVTKEESLERQVLQSQKMESIGALAGGIAHDFNNILSAIIGYTELAISQLDGQQGPGEDMEQVMNAALRARELVKQLLAFTRVGEHVKMRPVNMSAIVKETLKLVRAFLPSNIEIRRKIDDCGQVFGDPTRIQQALMNLCANAGHAMGAKGGKLEVGLGEVEVDQALAESHPELTLGRRARLTVRDNGSGIEKNVMDRIFEPFFTTKPTGEGTGLGLATVHGIITNHGGAVTVSSQPGEGSVFSIYLPLVDDEDEGSAGRGGEGFVPHGTERILFVDDEISIVNMGKSSLERIGYTIVTATNGSEALEIYKNAPDSIDLVITDQTMPGMAGEVLAQKLLSINPDLPVLLCTGYSPGLTEEKARALGIRRLIVKPALIRDLAVAIRQALLNKA